MFYALTVLVEDDTVPEVMQDDWLESIAQETLVLRLRPQTGCF